jgi:hypothetical protein
MKKSLKTNLQARLAQSAVALGLLAAGAAAHADTGIDTSASVTQISGTSTNVLAIGAAVFGVMVTIKLYKWLRQAL